MCAGLAITALVATATVLFIADAALTGVTLSLLVLAYTEVSIATPLPQPRPSTAW